MKRNLLVIGLLAVALVAAVHPEATLKSSVKSVEAGHEMPLQGEQFDAGDAVQLVLQGALAEYDLSSVTPEEGGVFAINVEIPANVRPGEYRLVAVASDGEIAARLDLTVTAAMPHETGEEDHEDMRTDADVAGAMGGMEEMGMAGDLPIERSRAGLEWGLIVLLIGLAGGGGVVFMRS
jgi:hypothetical protein